MDREARSRSDPHLRHRGESRRPRLFPVVAFLILLVPATLRAGCGYDQCPVDETTPWEPSRLLLEVTHQYIDQDQPRIGTDDAVVGQIESHHDEIRSINRQTTFRAVYKFGGGAWAAAALVPYVSRFHEHVEHHHDDLGGGVTSEEEHDQRFSYRGFADLETQIRRLWRPRGAAPCAG